MTTVTVDYGYDVHSVKVDPSLFQDFSNGEIVTLDGQGFMYDDEGWLQDHWVFDGETKEVRFWLDNGAEFFVTILNVDHSK
jgi:hypothetical protein